MPEALPGSTDIGLNLGFRGVAADIVLSVPPALDVEFLKDPPPLDT